MFKITLKNKDIVMEVMDIAMEVMEDMDIVTEEDMVDMMAINQVMNKNNKSVIWDNRF